MEFKTSNKINITVMFKQCLILILNIQITVHVHSFFCAMGTPEEAISPQKTHISAETQMYPMCTHTTFTPFHKTTETSFLNAGGLLFLHTQHTSSVSLSRDEYDSKSTKCF